MNREKKKMRFNFVDAIIILIVLAILGAAAYLVITDLNSQKASRQTGNMAFTVRLSSVDEEVLALLENGMEVKDSVTGAVIGTITDIQSEKTKYYGSTAVLTGNKYTISVSEHENKYDIYVTISVAASRDSRGIHYIGNTKILVGSTVYFQVPSFAAVSYIVSFTPMAAR